MRHTTLALFILITLWTARADAEPPETNYLTLGAGAVVVKASAEAELAGQIALDGSTQTLTVGTPKREPLPLTFVIELPAATTFTRFQFPAFNEYGTAQGRHARTVRLEGSSSSPSAGFTLLAEARLESGQKEAQRFPVKVALPVRWVRVTLVDRMEEAKRPIDGHLFTELEGYGAQTAIATPAGTFEGRWRYRRKGLNDEPGTNIIELFQHGQEVTGCQTLGGQLQTISGTIIDGLARLVAEDGQGKRRPFTAIVTSDKQLSGVNFAGPARPFYAAPDATAKRPCVVKPPANPVLDALTKGQAAILYGIYFNVDSDALRPDADPALQQLLAALVATPGLAVTVKGHTDSDGTEAHNLDLSQRRAKAVVAWLVARGVAAARLVPVGRGEGEPIADNSTSAGRALNRRVEIEPKK